MELRELRKKLAEVNIEYKGDPEVIHSKMDELLLEYIGDKRVTDLFHQEVKWYS